MPGACKFIVAYLAQAFLIKFSSNIKLDPVIYESDEKVQDLLRFYMGKNTPERQSFIIDNLKIENNIESNI